MKLACRVYPTAGVRRWSQLPICSNNGCSGPLRNVKRFYSLSPLRLLLGCTVFAACLSSPAAILPPGFTETQFGASLSGLPTAMEFAPDGRLFVCLQTGQVRIIKNGLLLLTPFLDIQVDSSGERGLLGIAFDPNFTSNHYLYSSHLAGSQPGQPIYCYGRCGGSG